MGERLMQRVLCDTCALIWLATGDAKLSSAARSAIGDADFLCFSSVSIWEIARKMKCGDLEMPVPPDRFSELLVSQYGMQEIPIDVSVALRAADLPEFHKDPADRFIIATAIINNCSVATGDRRFAAYGINTL